MKNVASIASVALIITGLLLVVLGLAAGEWLTVVGLGIVALTAGGLIQVMDNRTR